MKIPAERLVREYQQNLFKMALTITRNPADADDAVQDVFIKYVRLDPEFENEEHARAWLMRCVINRSKDIRRSFWNRTRISLEDYMETPAFESSQDSLLFQTVLSLPEKYRVVLQLYYYEEYTTEQIAGMLKISRDNVKKRLSRARKMMKEQLKEGWDDE